MTEEEIPNTTFLKWVVIILGIFIVAVASAIGVILYKRATKATPEITPETVAPQAPIASPGVPFGLQNLSLPEGAVVLGAQINAGRIVVTYGKSAENISGLYILDVSNGTVLGQFTFD